MTEQLTEETAPEPAAPVRVAWAPIPRVNLLPIEIIEARQFHRTQGLLGAAVLGAVVIAGAGTFLAQQGVDRANDDLATSQAKVSALQTEQHRYASVPKVIDQVEAASAARTLALNSDVLWYRFLNDLDGARPSGIELTGLTVTMNDVAAAAAPNTNPLRPMGVGTFTVSGQAAKYSQVSSWLEATEKLNGMTDSDLTSATKDDADNGAISFNASAVVTSDALSGRYEKKAG